MNRTYKLFTILFALVLLSALMPVTAAAAEVGVRPESVVAGDLTCTDRKSVV